MITFSSPHKIFRHIDYLTRPDDNNHKCRLLNEDIHHVDYTPGGTHTLGAFLEAEVNSFFFPRVLFFLNDKYYTFSIITVFLIFFSIY